MSTPYRGPDLDALAAFDPDIAGVVTDELDRPRGGLRLIAGGNATTSSAELIGSRPEYPEPIRAG